MSSISFGTDGWRAVIAEEYTFDNLARVAQATARWLDDTPSAGSDEPGSDEASTTVALGYDARFLGRRFAKHAARAMAASSSDGGVERLLVSESVTPTPAVSWATEALGADAGVVITASHNPPEYNGYKIKAPFGGSAPPAQIAEVEKRIPDAAPSDLPPFDALVDEGRAEMRDLAGGYLDALRKQLDLEAIREASVRVGHDAMFGASRGLLRRLLGDDHVVELHAEDNPGFEGTPPEPIARYLGDFLEMVPREGCDVGIANDGDGDRIGMVDESGRFVTPHEIMALLVKYLHEERGRSGRIAKTFAATHMLDAMADHYGLPMEVEPIGFKHLAPKLVGSDGGPDVLVCGEESGGIAAGGYLPERDGIYIGLLVVEMMTKRRKPLSALVAELHEAFGPHHYYRDDIRTTDAQKQKVLGRLDDEGGLRKVDGHPVAELDTLDGVKHIAEDGRWVLVRPSGTEPVLRVYAEAPTPDEARALVEDAAGQLGLS
jgi:phosphomannomutase